MEKLTSWLIGNNFFWKFFSKAYLYFFLLSSANANPEFQGRGGENIASKIVNTLNNIFSVNNFDLSQLCISEGKKCWHLYVDIVVS